MVLRYRNLVAFAVALVLADTPKNVLAQLRAKIDVPIMVGGDESTDACLGSGEIVGLDPRGDGFLSVRSGPGGRPFREMDRLYNGNHIYICESHGPWYAIIYNGDRVLDSACGVTKPWITRQPYTGPCQYGWVHSRYVKVIAG